MRKIKFNKRILIVILLLVITVVSGTFAWFTYQSNKSALVLNIGDLNDSRVTIKPYQIKETMTPVNVYTSGVYSQVDVVNENSGKMLMTLFYKVNELSSELANAGLKYTIVSSTSKNGTYTEVLTGDFIDIDVSGEKEILDVRINGSTNLYYRVYLWLDSNTGEQSAIQNSVLDVELNARISRDANAPVLDEGMIPVTISNDGTVTTILSSDEDWYNYADQEWANIVLVSESSRSTYLNTENVTVNQSDILAYYVWIPRYKYKIWTTSKSSSGNEQSIDIVFETDGNPVVNGNGVNEYKTHPAFWWDVDSDGTMTDSELLPGIWVGKFETSTDSSSTCYTSSTDTNCNNTNQEPRILPNVSSLRYQTVSNQFQTALKFSGGTFDTSTGEVTFEGNTTYGLTTSTDSHMMKNSEWGAVAYLSHSSYGINSEIYINNSSGYYTGRSGGNVGGSQNGLSTQFPDDSTSTNGYNSYGYYTWTGQAIDVSGNIGDYASDRTLGTNASTTGNVTGVYDLSGGALEFVMGNYGNTAGSSGFSTFPSSKYYDLYSNETFTGDYSTNMSLCTLETCGGHALFETANWYSDSDGFVTSGGQWFRRGGHCSNGVNAGAFSLSGVGGGSVYTHSFRSVLVPYEQEIQIVSTISSYSCSNGSSGSEPYDFTYTGDCTVEGVGTEDWKVKFLTDGDFTPSGNMQIDAFLVGGGGGGGSSTNQYYGGGGGGGGYTTTVSGLSLTEGAGYSITIGYGGSADSDGGETSAFNYSASGGKAGKGTPYSPTGGAGGSGGGGGGYSDTSGGGDGGSDGSDGVIASGGTYSGGSGGGGQDTSTREFGETTGNLYSGGGGGGAGLRGTGEVGSAGSGGEGGGANGGVSSNGYSASANTGGGGGGSGEYNGDDEYIGGSGGSGIVVIRGSGGASSGNDSGDSGTSSGTATVIEWTASNYSSVLTTYTGGSSCTDWEVYENNALYLENCNYSAGSEIYAGAYTNNAYDLTNVDRISISIAPDSEFYYLDQDNNKGYFYIGLYDSSGTEVDESYQWLYIFADDIDSSNHYSVTSFSLDVSEFTGSYYINFGTYTYNYDATTNPQMYVALESLTLTSYDTITEVSWTSSTYSDYFTNYFDGSSYTTATLGTNTVKFSNKPSSYGWVESSTGAQTSTAYNLTNVDMISIEVDVDNTTAGYYDHGELGYGIYLSQNGTDVSYIVYGEADGEDTTIDSTLTMDTSGLTGSYYIGFGTYVYNGSDTDLTSNYLYMQFAGPLKLYG